MTASKGLRISLHSRYLLDRCPASIDCDREIVLSPLALKLPLLRSWCLPILPRPPPGKTRKNDLDMSVTGTGLDGTISDVERACVSATR